ncbi:MAG: hypothetical protein RLZZ450_2562 [Pseudomonadota bacterium]|jgi:hypothetical protein
MQPLTHDGQEQLRSIAQHYGVSIDAASSMLDSLLRGNGSMAQFNHPELGGYGQWMRGGMTMVGDMFNNGLKSLVDGLCNDLSRLLDNNPFEPLPVTQSNNWQAQGSSQSQHQGTGMGALAWSPMPSWWPSELGQPNSSGSQNNMRYAYFSGPRRLAIEQNGQVTVYDTLNHQIGGVSQQQSGGYSVSFTSQLGGVDLSQLPVISGNAPQQQPPQQSQQPQYAQGSYGSYDQGTQNTYGQGNNNNGYQTSPTGNVANDSDIFAKIERLADLRQKGVLTDDEFNAKKAELLSRI